MPVQTIPLDAERSPKQQAAPVWDRLWRYRPSDAKDDALLERERRGPRWALMVDRLEATFGAIEGLQTVELGSGRGDLSVLLAQRGARVTLLDASRAALEQAEHRFDRLGLTARFEQGDMFTTAEAWRDRFDVALSSGVIEHFKGDDRTSAITAHRRVIRPGGLTVISVPHAWCVPYRVWKLCLDLRRCYPYGMEIPYTRREIVSRARRAGFERTETHGLAFRQSVSDHWYKTLLGRRAVWADEPSCWDDLMGLVLLMFGWRDGVRLPGA